MASLCLGYPLCSQAHFLWPTSVKEEGQAKAVLYFSESAHAQDYHLPEAMADASVWQRTDDKRMVELEMDTVDTEGRVGLESELKQDGSVTLASTCDYGIYGGSLLSYYSKHVRSSNRNALGAVGPIKKLKLEILPRVVDGSIELSVLWEGRSKSEVEIVVTEQNEEEQELFPKAIDQPSRFPWLAADLEAV